MKIAHRMVPVEGIFYDGTADSIQEIRRVVSNTVGYDCVKIVHATAANAEHVEVDNVVMMDFTRVYIQPHGGEAVPVKLNHWVVTFNDRTGKPHQVLVFPESIFRGNFEIDNAHLPKDQ